MRVAFKIEGPMLRRAIEDLRSPHPFAAERVGFFSCRVGGLKPAGWVVLAHEFHPVADEDYLHDQSVGAMMGPRAIREAMQVALRNDVSMFHVHVHCHNGRPRFSNIDLSETAKFVPDFWHARPHLIHGAVVLSLDSIAGLCWHPQAQLPVRFSEFSVVGAPMRFQRS